MMIEVKASRSFEHPLGRFTRGRYYQVDKEDPQVKGLIKGGFLKRTLGMRPASRVSYVSQDLHDATDQEIAGAIRAMDHTGIDEFPGSGVGMGRTRPAQRETGTEVTDGPGGMESEGDNDDRSAPDASPGPEDSQ